jgi:hypothetical protein
VRALFLTSQRLLTQHWPAVAALLAPAFEHARGEFEAPDLLELCRDGRAVASLAFDDAGAPCMAMVFEFLAYPRRTVVHVLALAGRDLRQVGVLFWAQFREWARESGASEIQASTRPAMTRTLRRLGFTHSYDTVRAPC